MSLVCMDRNIPMLEDECVWIVTLSDGTIVYQDDNNKARPPGTHHSAWVRLRQYLAEREGLSIASWRLQFRSSNVVELPTGVGYVYSRAVLGSMSAGENTTTYYHIVGTVQDGDEDIVRTKYHSPSLVETEKAKIAIDKIHPDMIIWNNG